MKVVTFAACVGALALWLVVGGCQPSQQGPPSDAGEAAQQAIDSTVKHMSDQMKEAGEGMPGAGDMQKMQQEMRSAMEQMIPPEYRKHMGGGPTPAPAQKPQAKQPEKKQEPEKKKEEPAKK